MLLVLVGSCSRHKIIPDEELAQIFHDAFLTNAYMNTQSGRIDSLNLYEPIFARYGYTMEDVHYTIGNFSKRKSARLGDVVERAIQLLDEEGKYYDREVAILDTVDNVAKRTFTRTVFSDSLIRVRSLRDTAKLHIRIEDLKPGEYRVSLKYLIDSLDENRNMKGEVWIDRRDSTRANLFNIYLRRDRMENFTRTLTADSASRRLHLNLALFDGKPKRPSITLRDVEILWVPESESAVDSLFEQQLNLRIFADDFFRMAGAKDSL